MQVSQIQMKPSIYIIIKFQVEVILVELQRMHGHISNYQLCINKSRILFIDAKRITHTSILSRSFIERIYIDIINENP